MKERIIGIDVLKFMAVLLITNSHMDLLYGKYGFLGTGGTIGDVLFFFCSGYTLAMKPVGSLCEFPNWYKRRINRIYPTVFAAAIISSLFYGIHQDINHIILYGGGWFISCIMLYYIAFYFIELYFKDRIVVLILLVSIVSCIWFSLIDRPFPFNMYGIEAGYLKWIMYFNFMLLGVKLGAEIPVKEENSWRYSIFAVVGILCFYALYIAGRKYEGIEYIQFFNFIPLLFAVYYLFKWSNGRTAAKLYSNKVGHVVIRFIGGLCLEIYLIQGLILTDRLNFIFPANIPIMFCLIVVAAYLTRCFARFISQTFKDGNYNWQKIVDKY